MIYDTHRVPRNFIDAVEHSTSRGADRPAFTFLSDGANESERLSYGQLLRRAYAASLHLAELAPRQGRVILAMEPGLDYIVALLGCLYAQLIAVPAAPIKSTGPSRKSLRLREIMRSCDPSVILCSASGIEVLRQLDSIPPIIDMAAQMTPTSNEVAARELPACTASPETVALLQYTSGSTAAPKGVTLTHANLLHNQGLIQSVFGHSAESIIVGWLPLFHDMGLIGNICNTLYCAAQAVLMPPSAFVKWPLRWLQAISHYRATTSGGPNFAYELCVSNAGRSIPVELDLSSWTAAFVGAEPIRPATLKRFAAAFAPAGFHERAYLPCYGLAESTLIVSANPRATPVTLRNLERASLQRASHAQDLEFAQPGAEHATSTLVSSGAVVAGQEVLIVDPETREVCAEGDVGEIWISGPSVGNGYWNDAAATAETFEASLARQPARRYLRTRDLGLLLGGQLFICGRLADRFKYRGRNFYATEIEQLASESDPELVACAGAAFLVSAQDVEQVVLVQEVSRALAGKDLEPLARRITAEVLDQLDLRLDRIAFTSPGLLPRTSSGKIRRLECQKLLLAGALSPLQDFRAALSSSPSPKHEPEDIPEPIEAPLKQLVCAKLGLDPARCEPSTRLAELGVDSLAVVSLHNQLCKALSLEVPLAAFLQLNTLGELFDLAKLATLRGSGNRNTAPVSRMRASRGQQSLYFLQQANPSDAAYNISRAIELDTPVNLEALARAMRRLFDRHPILTHRFALEDGELWQMPREGASGSLTYVDLSNLEESALQSWLTVQHLRPFDLHAGPLLRLIVIRNNGRTLVMFLIHHIVCDLWSLSILWRDLGALYASETIDSQADLPKQGASYAEFVTSQERLLDSAEASGHRLFWQKVLERPPARLRLPSPVGGAQSGPRSGEITCTVGAGSLLRFKESCLRNQATLFMGLLAVIHAVLACISAQRELIIAAPFAGRRVSRWKETVGYCVNTVPLKIESAAGERFHSLLERVREAVLTAYSHAEYPFAMMIANSGQSAVKPDETLQILFALQALPEAVPDLGALTLGLGGASLTFGGKPAKSVAITDPTSQADIAFVAAELPEGSLALSLRYRSAVLDEEMARRLVSYVEAVICRVPEHLDARLESVLAPLSRQQEGLFRHFNATQQEFDSPGLLHELVSRQCRLTPTRLALQSTTRAMTYEHLDSLSSALARGLADRDLREATIAVYADRSPESVVAMLAILKCGGALLPLDPDHPAERLRTAIQDARAVCVLTSQPAETTLLDLGVRTVDIARMLSHRGTGEQTAPPASIANALSIAYVLFTSGSTGRPKGVAIPHGAICNRLLWMQSRYALTEADRVLHKTPPSFDVSIWEIFWPLISGATVVLAPSGAHKDVLKLHRLTREYGVSVIHFVPSLARLFFEPGISAQGCAALRLLVCSGEELTPDIVHNARRAGVQLVSNQYGPTEAAIDVSSWDCDTDIPLRIPIGRPIANTALYILDEFLNPVPFGAVGELYIGGRGLGRGYLGQPALTARSFLADPFGATSGGRMYRTGDLARYRSDGAIEYLGRRDTQVKLHGVRIELGEIESVIRQEAATTAAAVTVSGDRLIAFIVVRTGSWFDEARMRTHLQRHLPTTMIPHVLAPINALPLTASGKIDRAALRDLPLPSTPAAIAACAPMTALERTLVEIWSRVLKRPDVGIDDNFFGSGGDSILSMRVVVMAKARGYEISVDDLYRFQTVRQLAPHVRAVEPDRAEAPVAAFSLLKPQDRERITGAFTDAYPMTELQQGLLFHHHKSSQYEIYTTSMRVRIPGNARLLNEAFSAAIARHPMLRTSFDVDSYSEPIQLVHADATATVEMIDLSDRSPADQDALIRGWLAAERSRRFDWSMPPLVRFTVHVRSQDELQLTLSDPFLDGWSVATLFTEILRSYKTLLDGEALAIEAPQAASYADFVALEREVISSAQARAFWESRLAGAPLARLSCGAAAGSRGIGVQRLEVHLETQIGERLRCVASNLAVPLKSVLIAAHAQVAGLFSHEDDIVFGVVCNGRPVKKDGDRVLGAHLNTLPFRIDLRRRTWEEIIRDCFAYENDTLPYRRYPISLLQRERGRTPLFDTMLNFTHFHPYEEIARNTGLSVSNGYASEQTYYPLTTQCHLDHSSASITIAFDYLEQLPSELVHEFATCFVEALRSIGEETWNRHDAHARADTAWLGPHSGTTVPRNGSIGFLQRLLEHARTQPDMTAVLCSRACLSYRELAETACQISAELARYGVTTEDRVAICMERSTYAVACLLGVLLSGAAYVPIDTEQPPARIEAMLRRVHPAVILADSVQQARLPTGFTCLAGDTLVANLRGSVATAAIPRPVPEAENLAYVMFTSGSTGIPKAVAVPYGGLQNLIDWHLQAYRIDAGDRVSQIASFGFDACVWEIWPALTAGATVCILTGTARLDPNELLGWLRQQRITGAFIPTPLFEACAGLDWGRTALRYVLTGGDVLHAWCPPNLPFDIVNHYGPTENTVVATAARISDRQPIGSVPPIGTAILNNNLLLLDVFGRPARAYVLGEIYIRGHSLARGYFGDAAATAERFLPAPGPDSPGSRMYRTGDLAYRLPDGELFFSGRADTQVKIRGVRIETAEIEALLGAHADIAQAAVVLLEDRGSASSQLAAYILARRPIDLGAVKAYLRKALPEIMVPRHLIELPQLPLGTNGKLNRAALPRPVEHLSAPVPITDPTAREIAQIWQEVLGHEQVGLDANFFEIGGHSLLATQVVSRLGRVFGFPVPLAMVFEHPGLAEFTEHFVALCLRHAGESRLHHALEELDFLSDEQVDARLAPQPLPGQPHYSDKRLDFVQPR